jgi:hypothetical protein
VTVQWTDGKRPVFIDAGWTMIRRYMSRTKASNAKKAATMRSTTPASTRRTSTASSSGRTPNWGNVQGPAVWLDVAQMMQVMPWRTSSSGCSRKRWPPARAAASTAPPSYGRGSRLSASPPEAAHNWAQPETIGRDGPHLLNTSGGNLAGGRIHGFGHMLATAMQMMRTAGVRQVKNAEVALRETGASGSASS